MLSRRIKVYIFGVGASLISIVSSLTLYLSDKFIVYRQGVNFTSKISIDYSDHTGVAVDVGGPVELCDKGQSLCLKFPILFSVPPRLPMGESDTVRWIVDKYKFEISTIGEKGYKIQALGGRNTVAYIYDKKEGLNSWTLVSPTGEVLERWERMWGTLRFEDIEALLEDYDFDGGAYPLG